MSESKTTSTPVESLTGEPLNLSDDLVRQTRKVVDRRRRAEALLKSAEDGKEKVKPEIYEKVTTDYRAQLDDIADEYAPLRDQAGEELRRIKDQEQILRWELGEINDSLRRDYIKRHLVAAHRAIQQGVNLKRYYLWSCFDNFEWVFGFSRRFGLIYVDFETQERIWKGSAYDFQSYIQNNGLVADSATAR